MNSLHPTPDGSTNPDSRGYVHTQVTTKDMKSYLLSVVAILIAAVPGSLIAHWGVSKLGLSGISLAIATVLVGMVLSVAFFAGLIALGRAVKFIK